MENLPASCPMEAIRADVLAVKGRAKAQRCDTLAKNALFIEFVRRWEAGLAAGEGTKDLKRRLGSLEARNTELDEECDGLSTRRNEQEAMFAEWELSHDQRRVRTSAQGISESRRRAHRHSKNGARNIRRQGRRAEPADPVAKKQKTEPRKAKGGWGGSRRGAAFEAKSASSGTAEQKGAKGQPLSE